ncbi:sodium/hydrogen exchanger 9B1-like [Sorex fumeus]|uniref:sodium/hydrogen exchanger 9B1-like n=1 Tax=Sorex fumeus TaxID=62283 RepID=UPI0024AD34E3|nr:sodium/hydrogen exchanger 9B1-like [Sorex fumeus]
MISEAPRNDDVESESRRSTPASKASYPDKVKHHRKDSPASTSKNVRRSQGEKEPDYGGGRLNEIITNAVILLLGWCAAWAIAGPEVLPGGSLFGLIIIFYSAILGGKLLECISIPSVPPLPPLLGMLLAGFAIRNIPFLNKIVSVNSAWSSTLRNMALTVILVRAGLGLDPQVLKTMKGVCLRLSIGPCLTESLSAAIISHYLLGFPWEWGFLVGFVVGAVSPAVVVPSMIMLQEKGYGIQKGIPTLLMAASSLDDILAITGFNICISLIFSTGTVMHNILGSVRDIIIGVLIGAALGIFVRYFPSRDQEHVHLKRAFLILGLCISAVLGSIRVGLHAAGGLCTLVLTFMAGLSWAAEKVSVQHVIAVAWDVFQPLLFGLVGSEINVSALETNALGTAVATVILAVSARVFFTFLLMSFAGFNIKEKLFIALAWLPKATVQAVLGPLAYETVRAINKFELEQYSKDVMTVAFLAILITAPNGALIIGILGPKVLTRHDPRDFKGELMTVLHH